MKKPNYLLLSYLLVLTFAAGCSRIPTRSTNYVYQKPQVLKDGIATGELENVEMDSSSIIDLTKLMLADSISNMHSLLILKDNKLVYENYFAGKDQKHGKKLGYIDHSINQLHDCRSVSKSITSACIGIAIKKG